MPTPDAYIVQICAISPHFPPFSPIFGPLFPGEITLFTPKWCRGRGGRGGWGGWDFGTPVHEVMRGFGAESTEKYIV